MITREKFHFLEFFENMAKSPIPSKPWADLGCDPLALVEVAGANGATNRATPMDFCRRSNDT
jgi:hypothetical protein